MFAGPETCSPGQGIAQFTANFTDSNSFTGKVFISTPRTPDRRTFTPRRGECAATAPRLRAVHIEHRRAADANRGLLDNVEHAIPTQGGQRAAHCGRSASVLRVVLKTDVNGGNHTTAEHSGQA